MISESQQEEATLYALELLDADEAVSFERQIEADPELRELVRDLQETAALLALSEEGPAAGAPPALRDRVLAEARANHQFPAAPPPERTTSSARVTAPRPLQNSWLPWAIAAMFLGCPGVLWWVNQTQEARHQQAEANTRLMVQKLLVAREGASHASPDPLAAVSFCALEPTPDFATAQPRAAVLWDAEHHQGKLRVNRLAPPGAGRDYQLWTVEAGRKDAVSAGVIHVDANGKADLPFQPVEADGKPVVAVAISLEQAGGSPTNQGPILLLGKF